MMVNIEYILNHACPCAVLYFNTLAPVNSTNISVMAGPLTSAFGSVDGFKKNFTEAALTVFGSGWAWLTVWLSVICIP